MLELPARRPYQGAAWLAKPPWPLPAKETQCPTVPPSKISASLSSM